MPFTAKAADAFSQTVNKCRGTMAHVKRIVVFALLQYCSAEIASNLPGGTWYAANVITDPDFSPKPLTEIFSTERAFLSTNPIVVLPPSTASALVDTTTQPQTLSSQTTVSLPPSTFASPAPISTSTLTTTAATQSPSTVVVAAQTQTNAPTTTNPPATIPPSQTPSQPQQNFFYIYPQPQGPGAPQPQVVAATPAPCATTTQNPTQPQTTTVATFPANFPLNNTAQANTTRPFPFPIRIRMLSPAGSITNINFVGSTTLRPTTTRRNRRRNRNNYDNCVDTCGDRRDPICATPLGTRPINPDTLKGFPTICHMACHNSFRRNAFEKVSDGRCGRLRNRLRPQLTRAELTRNRYTILSNPGTVIEFQPVQNSL